MKKILTALAFMAVTGASVAQPAAPEPLMPSKEDARVGFAQDDAISPPELGNMRLTDPLVQRKYLADPDMMRFLRGAYAESCTRGMIRGAINTIRNNVGKAYTPEQQEAARIASDSNRIWKLTSLEMEMLLGRAYLRTANYCDCLLKEIVDHDIVNPKHTVIAIKSLPEPTLKMCNAMAEDLTEQQMKKRKSLKDMLADLQLK